MSDNPQLTEPDASGSERSIKIGVANSLFDSVVRMIPAIGAILASVNSVTGMVFGGHALALVVRQLAEAKMARIRALDVDREYTRVRSQLEAIRAEAESNHLIAKNDHAKTLAEHAELLASLRDAVKNLERHGGAVTVAVEEEASSGEVLK